MAEQPHPDATQLLSIADLLPTLSGADPAMLANVGHYLRGLSDRVKVLPVARTGPLRVAAEAVSAPVEAVPRVAVVKTLLHDGHDDEGDSTLYIHGVEVVQMSMCGGLDHLEELAEKINKSATTPPQAEPSLAQQLQNAREDFAAMKALTESGAAEIARLTAELADEKAVVDVLRSELQDRLQKQRAAEAELQEVRTDAGPLSYRDVEFQIGDGPREKLFDAPFELMIMCTRVGAWELYGKHISLNERELLAGEYASIPLRLYVAGRQILGAAPEAPKP
jgi:hypothetical protein